MRPRKRILLIDSNEDRLSELRFVLEIKGYRVIHHARGEINAIIAHWPIAYGVAKKLKANNPDTPLIVLAPCADRYPHCIADVKLWNNIGMAALLELLIMLTPRKKGPKSASEREEFDLEGVA